MIARRFVLLFPLWVAGCGAESESGQFASLNYGYLTPIRLNVASIEIDDQSPPPAAGSLETIDPIRPADALKQMARDRLRADGSAGRAVFVIDQAMLSRRSDGLDGTMAVHLDVFAGLGGQRVGYAEARVVRRRTSTDSDNSSRAVLYEFTKQMMSDMNVEFEYQVHRSLRDWVQATSDSAPLPAPVEAQPLPNEFGDTPSLSTPAAPIAPLPDQRSPTRY